MDLPTIAEYGSRGVLALFADSTNSERSGFTPSETTVIERLDEIFHHALKKVIVCCFTSSIHRIQIVLDLAQKYDRKVVLAGRSMLANTKIASELGFLRIPDGILIKPQAALKLPKERVAMLMTGSQGEPMAALPRLAVDNYKNIVIEPDDSVIISARIIPGNEKTISRMINHIYKRDAHVYYDDGSLPPVHVSGHACAEELKLLLNLVRPKFFVPIHGEYRQLFRHAELARNLHAVKNKVLIAESGDRIQFREEDASIVGKVPVGRIYIAEGSLDEVEEVVVRDRRHLAEDGIVLPVLANNTATGKLEGQAEIITRGFVFVDEDDSLMSDSKARVLKTLEESTFEEVTDWAIIKEKIRTDLRRFLFKQTSKRPLVLPVILEI
jgi:ribonuclease J